MRHIKRVEVLERMIKRQYPTAKVITPNDVPFNRTHDSIRKSQNRKFYFENILDSDKIILFVGDHIGKGTTLEIGFSLAHNKEILYSHSPPNTTQTWDEIWALIVDHSIKKLTQKMIGGNIP